MRPRAPPPQRHLAPQEERRRCGRNATNASYHAAPPPTPNSSTDAIVTIAVGEASAAGAVVLGAQLERVGSTSIWIALVEEVSNRTAAALVGVDGVKEFSIEPKADTGKHPNKVEVRGGRADAIRDAIAALDAGRGKFTIA